MGDCRAVALRGPDHAQPFTQLTTDMRATYAPEAQRIAAAGGEITDGRVWGGLIPSRTLGDFPWKDKGPGLIATPEEVELEVTPDLKYLVIGSDGLFDVLPNKTIANPNPNPNPIPNPYPNPNPNPIPNPNPNPNLTPNPNPNPNPTRSATG